MTGITGHILPHALASLIHAGPEANPVRYWAALQNIRARTSGPEHPGQNIRARTSGPEHPGQNIRDCIDAGDAWFLDAAPAGWRVWTCSGFSAIVPDKTSLTRRP